jgi:hypothetical protein
MGDNLHIDSGLLKKYFDGKLSKAESESVTALLEKDEFYREAFLNLKSAEFLVVEKISSSVNEKMKKVLMPPPFYLRWQIWLSVFIGLVAITSFVLLYDYTTDLPKKESKAKNESHSTQSNTHESSTKINSSGKPVIYSETTMNFESENHSDDNALNRSLLSKKDTLTEKKKTVDEKNIQDAPSDNKTDEKKNNSVVNDHPNTQDPGKKSFRLWVEDVAVVNTQNLADKEAASGDGRENMNVTNPNIGSDLSKRKTNSYNLEDMPQYKGGNEALSAYVKGRIALKSYHLKESSVSTVVEFVVTSKGKVEDIKFQNPLDPVMEKDIREVLSNVTFSPGKKSGKKGSMYYMMALMFGS